MFMVVEGILVFWIFALWCGFWMGIADVWSLLDWVVFGVPVIFLLSFLGRVFKEW